ncbi:DUF5956 family protein [Arthrobacter sp. 24S4-2]|uniref:DUF5956 family protein n=1 Tax=Arthrobacter sp. 24S4-2 TaxID=2575374 RepID=UPI0020C7AC56|nr:DUF5956 family protein [Arthrobacter sp. 24S4-2]
MNKDPWASPELTEAPAGWILATENGWGALVLWAAGQGNFVRIPLADRSRQGIIVHQFPDGSERRTRYVPTEADLDSIDDDIDTYLADAELPPRPRGYDWFIRPPDATLGEDAFWSAIWAATTAALSGEAVRPSTMKDPVKEVLTRMYVR